MTGLFEACKPEVLGNPVVRMVAVVQYLRGVIESIIEQRDIESAQRRIGKLLDESLVVGEDGLPTAASGQETYVIRQKGRQWDLSRIDFEKLREEFKQTHFKNIEIADLRAFLEKKMTEMLRKNSTRRDFAERLQEVINRYNAGSTSADACYEELMQFAAGLQEEEDRHIRQGLTEDELELYDLLCKEKMTKEEEQSVRLAAKALLKPLTEEHPKVLVQDWYKDSQTRLVVKDAVTRVLDNYLPQDSYDSIVFNEKRDKVFDLTLDLAINHLKWAV